MKIFLNLSLLLLFAGCVDTLMQAEFKSRAEVGDFIEKGWLPYQIPKAAKNIKVRYDLDENIGCGVYELQEAEALPYLMTMQPVSIEDIKKVNKRLESLPRFWFPWKASWWPKNLLNGEKGMTASDTTHLYYYTQGQLYFWLKPKQ